MMIAASSGGARRAPREGTCPQLREGGHRCGEDVGSGLASRQYAGGSGWLPVLCGTRATTAAETIGFRGDEGILYEHLRRRRTK